ncbi:MAG: PorT family protein [Muribaculaceae bacterium]|nr:PorT family protein [Muribaculaceae bacterium]
MKKILLTIFCLAVAFGASAKFRWGPSVGANFPYYYWEQNLVSSTTLAGFSAGVQCELMIPGIGFGVDFGLKYANRGGRVAFGDQYVWSSDGIGTVDLRLQTIQIPVNLRFKWTRMNGIENYVAPFVYAGPEFNINVANTKCDAVKRAGASLGLGVGLGAELFKRYQLSGGYVWDVTYDVKTHKLDDFSARLEGWVVNFAVLF